MKGDQAAYFTFEPIHNPNVQMGRLPLATRQCHCSDWCFKPENSLLLSLSTSSFYNVKVSLWYYFY